MKQTRHLSLHSVSRGQPTDGLRVQKARIEIVSLGHPEKCIDSRDSQRIHDRNILRGVASHPILWGRVLRFLVALIRHHEIRLQYSTITKNLVHAFGRLYLFVNIVRRIVQADDFAVPRNSEVDDLLQWIATSVVC